MNKKTLRYLFSLLAIFFVVTPITIEVQSQADKKQIEYKKTRVLQNSTAKRMALVYEALEVVDEKGEPNPDMKTVLSILNELKDNMANLKSYDRSVIWNAWAYVYFMDGDYPKAMSAYERLLDEPEATISLRVGALYSLAQLNLLEENYEAGIYLIRQWMSEAETVTAQSYALLGQAYFQIDDFKKALSSMENAFMIAENEGYKPRENWYVIMAACIGEMKKEIGEEESLYRQIDIYETLVDLYPKKQYFIQLGGSYEQLGFEREYMSTLKIAYEKDLLDKESEYLALTQLLLLNEDATSALEVFEYGRNKMITLVDEKTEEEKIVPVIKDTEKNLKLLADIKNFTYSGRINLNPLEVAIGKPKVNFKSGDSFFKDGSYIPLFKVIPIYPRRAKERGTMGYALVEFTITESGVVEDIVVVEGYCSNSDPNDPATEFRPCTMFNSASASAAQKLKYKPKIVDGKAVPVEGVLHRFTFALDEN